MTAINVCTHDGEHCDGAEFCNTCNVQIFSGFKDADERYCNDHKPATWDAEIAEMTEEEFDDQDEMYWTEWEIEDIQCECPVDCPCQSNPEALEVLYEADRVRTKEDNNANSRCCELCNDERLEEDLNEDGLCEPCAEAKAKQGYLIGE